MPDWLCIKVSDRGRKILDFIVATMWNISYVWHPAIPQIFISAPHISPVKPAPSCWSWDDHMLSNMTSAVSVQWAASLRWLFQDHLLLPTGWIIGQHLPFAPSGHWASCCDSWRNRRLVFSLSADCVDQLAPEENSPLTNSGPLCFITMTRHTVVHFDPVIHTLSYCCL